jgi:hypothetical protein
MKTLYLFVVLLFIGCTDKIISIRATQEEARAFEKHKVFGYYSLPKTELKILLPISKDTLVKGMIKDTLSCIGKYVYNNFGWLPEKEPDEKYAIDQKILLLPITLPDPDKRYAMLYNKSKALSQTMNITISRDGLIQSGEFAQESRAFEITKKAIELGGTLIGAAAGLGSSPVEVKKCDLAAIQNKRAVQLIKDVEALIKARYTLISTSPINVNTTDIIKMQIGEIDDQLKSIKAILLGQIKKKIYNVPIYLDFKEEKLAIPLVRINPKAGVITNGKDKWKDLSMATKDSTSEKKLVLNLRKLLSPDVLSLPVSTATTPATGGSPETSGNQTQAFLYYNVPAKYELTLTYNGKPIVSYSSKEQKEGSDDYQLYIPQFGRIAFLPADDFKEASVTYYEDLGALKSSKFTKEARADAEKTESLYKAIDSLRTTIKAIKAKNQEEEEEPAEEKVEEQVIRLIIENTTPAGNQ